MGTTRGSRVAFGGSPKAFPISVTGLPQSARDSSNPIPSSFANLSDLRVKHHLESRASSRQDAGTLGKGIPIFLTQRAHRNDTTVVLLVNQDTVDLLAVWNGLVNGL
jgi:hypothetical protein